MGVSYSYITASHAPPPRQQLYPQRSHTWYPSSTAELSFQLSSAVWASTSCSVRFVGPAGGVVEAVFEGAASPAALKAITRYQTSCSLWRPESSRLHWLAPAPPARFQLAPPSVDR